MRRPALLLVLLLVPALAMALTPAQQLALQTPADTGRIVLRFAEEPGLRMETAGPASHLAGKADAFLARLANIAPGAELARRFGMSPEALDGLRIRAERRGARDLTDLNRYAQLESGLANRAERLAMVKALLADPAIEAAWLEPVAVPAALGFDAFTGAEPQLASGGGGERMVTPDFTNLQGYLNDAPEGVGAWSVDAVPGARGSTVSVVDIEGAWLWTHEDLPAPLIELGGVVNSDSWRHHGTAVLGEIRGTDNAYGVRGITPDCQVGCSSIAEQSVAGAILNGAAALEAGDILLIELHAPGPNSYEGGGQFGYVPMEFWQDNFDAIRTATALGRIVCEAAGNGAQDLDDPVYMDLFDRLARDSGAIMCGATDGSSLIPAGFTNYGSRVDLHGWGYYVTTCGYGGLQGEPLPEEEWYTEGFSGTSSASPIVVGAVAALQGMVEAEYGYSLDATLAREILSATGTPQDEPERNIGPRPNLVAAWAHVSANGLGHIEGTVTDAVSGLPLADVDVEVLGADVFTRTDATGHYGFLLEPDTYIVTFREFFHGYDSALFTLTDGDELTVDMPMQPLPLVTVGGSVVDENSDPLAGAKVTPQDVPLAPAWSDATGHFDLLDVPEGTEFAFTVGGLPGHGASWSPGWQLTGLPGDRDDMMFTLLLPDVDFDFEADDGGFATDGDPVWSWGAPSAGGPAGGFGGANCWGVGMAGDYADDEFGGLLSPSFDFSGETHVSLSFHLWRGTEHGFDGVRVRVWDGADWQAVLPGGGYTDVLLGGLGNAPGWSGVSAEWEPVEFAISAGLLSADFRFRLDFGSDGGVVGEGFWIDDIALFAGSTLTPVEESVPSYGQATLAAYPNPFNPATTIRWRLPEPGLLSVDVYDLRGRRVRALFDGRTATATGALTWDGRDDAGRALASGVYLLRLKGEDGLAATGRAVLLK